MRIRMLCQRKLYLFQRTNFFPFTSLPSLFPLLHPLFFPSVLFFSLLRPLLPFTSLQPSDICSFHPPFLPTASLPVSLVFLPLPSPGQLAL